MFRAPKITETVFLFEAVLLKTDAFEKTETAP